METFKIVNLNFRYPDTVDYALKDISFSVNNGEFITLCGPSGSGKSTLLRHLKPSLSPHGEKTGSIIFEGREITDLSQREQSEKIGYVLQSPDNQIVTDKVWHELAFGLENLGYDNVTIRKRVAETASFFGLENLFEKNVNELSGGQKQLLNLASIMTMQPSVLILDEPTSQLDPIASSDFLACISKINRELGTTIIITEHRLEDMFPLSDKVLVIENGQVVSYDTPKNTGRNLKAVNSSTFLSLPAPMRIWYEVEKGKAECPVTIAQGREWLEKYAETNTLKSLNPEKIPSCEDEISVELENVWFRYEKNTPDVLKGLSFEAKKGEFVAVLGGNGAGKSTMLSLISSINKPYKGKLKLNSESIAMLPQNPQSLFVKKSVKAELEEMSDKKRISSVTKLCRLERLLDRHPYDLSGGEQQRVALAKILLLQPEILLLDEPTKGLDSEFKIIFADIIRTLTESGVTVIMVSHDVEFCAKYPHRCVMFFNGEIVAQSSPRKFFSSNSFYTTSANRISRNIIENAVTPEDVIYCCTGVSEKPKPLKKTDLYEEKSQNIKPVKVKKVERNKLSKRTITATVMILLAIPLTIFVGVTYLEDKKYLFISLLVMLECMLPFFLVFEGRKPQARELVIISVMCALAVASRMATYFLPQFKPVLAVIIIAGSAFGAESGFLVGAVTMLVSNIMFQQGPWTPWQMFAAGLTGYFAGLIFQKRKIKHVRIAMSIFGFIATVLIYGVLMNISSAVLVQTELNFETIITFCMSGLPFDLVHAVSTVIFLFIGSKPILSKLERVKSKYGLLD